MELASPAFNHTRRHGRKRKLLGSAARALYSPARFSGRPLGSVTVKDRWRAPGEKQP